MVRSDPRSDEPLQEVGQHALTGPDERGGDGGRVECGVVIRHKSDFLVTWEKNGGYCKTRKLMVKQADEDIYTNPDP